MPARRGEMLLEVQNLTKTYKSGGETVYAVKNANFTLAAGELIAVVGPSGAGKSTLLHLLGSLDKPDSGRLLHEGADVYKLSDARRARWRNKNIGFVFQFYHLIEELNILENILISALDIKGSYAKDKALGLLDYLGIKNRAGFFPSQLSGGEKQKVAIARALINDAPVLLCDEPTGNLDHASQEKVVDLLEKLNRERGKAVVMVTHNLDLARRCRRTLSMESGSVKAS